MLRADTRERENTGLVGRNRSNAVPGTARSRPPAWAAFHLSVSSQTHTRTHASNMHAVTHARRNTRTPCHTCTLAQQTTTVLDEKRDHLNSPFGSHVFCFHRTVTSHISIDSLFPQIANALLFIFLDVPWRSRSSEREIPPLWNHWV